VTNNCQRDHEVGACFAANADRLNRIVARRVVNTSREVIEDACASAWTILVGRPDITLDARGLAWLVAVATNEALRLVSKTRPERLAGGFLASRSDDASREGMLEPVADTRGVDEVALARVEHEERLAALRRVKPRDRQALFLKGMGYSYREIMEITDATYTAVNRRITEGRAALGGLTATNASPREPG
jgi:DNA-directed RNA polymerase specialized sigma24 family protein